jgi:hypothetical protein
VATVHSRSRLVLPAWILALAVPGALFAGEPQPVGGSPTKSAPEPELLPMPKLLSDSPEAVHFNAPAMSLTSAIAAGAIEKMNMPADGGEGRSSGLLGVMCVCGFVAMVIGSYLLARWRYRAG